MKEISCEQIAAVASKATTEVFETMLLPMEIQLGDREESINYPQLDGVVALVGIGGAWIGSGRISCSAPLACRLAGTMLMAEYENVNDDVLDAMSEIANMIIGSMKTTFEERLGTLALSIPMVVYGRNYQTRCPGVRKWTVVPVSCGGETMDVCFFLVQNQVNAAPIPRTEELYA